MALPSSLAGLASSLALLQWRLYLTLLLRALLPTFYSSLRLRLLGKLPDDSAVNIASQVAWLGLAFEVLQEFLIMPLYFLLGSSITDISVTRNNVKTGLGVLCLFFSCTSGLLYLLAPSLVQAMAQDSNLREATTRYIRLEIFGLFLESINSFLTIPLQLLDMSGALLYCLLLKFSLTIFLDLTFLSSLPFSLQLGVQGIAYSSLLTSLATSLLLLLLLCRRLHISLPNLAQPFSFLWLRHWLTLGLYSGLDSIVRNLTYTLVILRSMNLLEESGLYWTTTTFIWSWLLLPFLPLSEVLRVRVATVPPSQGHLSTLAPYLLITLAISIAWLLSIPAWFSIYDLVFSVQTPSDNVRLTLILLPFYITFMFGHLLTSVLYALGKTKLIALKSFVGNIAIGSFFALTLTDVLPVSLTSVSLIFGFGLSLGSVTALGMYCLVLRKQGWRL